MLQFIFYFIALFKVAAETAYDVVSPGPDVTDGNLKRYSLSNKAEQPADLREGVTNAYNVLSEVRVVCYWSFLLLTNHSYLCIDKSSWKLALL